MQSIPDAVVVAEFGSGEVVAANEATERLFDARPQELIGLHHLQLHPEDDADRYREAFRRGLESERVSHLSDGSRLHVETMSGERKPVEINAQRLQADGQTFVLGVFRDVSERVAKEQQLEQATVRLETLLDSTPLPVAVLDTDGRVQLWNQAAEDVFGYSPKEVVGERYPLLVDNNELDRLVERLLDGERITDYETVQRAKNGSRIDVALYVRPLYQEGEITGFIGSGIDISDRKRRRRHLDVTHRVLRHNLRNNLSVIQGYASLISEEAEVGSSEQEAADSITAAAGELAELSDHASQVRQSIRQPNTTPTEVSTLVTAIADVGAEATGTAVELQVGETDATVPLQAQNAVSRLLRRVLAHVTAPQVDLTVRLRKRHVELYLSARSPLLSPGDTELITSNGETALKHGQDLDVARACLSLWSLGGDILHLACGVSGDTETSSPTCFRVEIPRLDLDDAV